MRPPPRTHRELLPIRGLNCNAGVALYYPGNYDVPARGWPAESFAGQIFRR